MSTLDSNLTTQDVIQRVVLYPRSGGSHCCSLKSVTGCPGPPPLTKKGSKQWKKLWLLLAMAMAMAIPFQPVYSEQVEYVLTVEECRAEQALWMSRLDEPNDAGTVNVNYSDLNDWSLRMLLCGSVDPELRWQYYNTQRELSEVQTERLIRFLVRHNLYGQFLAEDAQGKR